MTDPKTPPAAGQSPTPDLPAAGGSREAAAATDMAAVLVNAVAGAAAANGGGLTFDFVFNNTTYTVQVFAPDANSQYGFRITKPRSFVLRLAVTCSTRRPRCERVHQHVGDRHRRGSRAPS